MAIGPGAWRCRPSTLRQQPWESQGSSPTSRTTEQSLDPNRTHKAGYRDRDRLWSGCFEDLAGRPCGHRRSVREFQQRCGGDRRVGRVLPPAWAWSSSSWRRPAAMNAAPSCCCGRPGSPCGLTNPRSVRRYAEAMGILEKTDRLDAAVIARFAHRQGPQADAARRAAPQQRLAALVARLRQVTDDLVVQKQRRSCAMDRRGDRQHRPGDRVAQAPGSRALMRLSPGSEIPAWFSHRES